MKPTVKIVLTGGGSGGHIVPLLSLARALKSRAPDSQLVYVGWRGEEAAMTSDISRYFDELYFISAGKFRRYHGESFISHILDIKTLALNIRDFFRVISGTWTAWRLLRKLQPAAVFSKGGFVAVPVGLAARINKVAIITHDSDTVPGLANRIIGRWAVVRATGQPLSHYSQPPPNAQYTGIPVDPDLKPVTDKAQQELKLSLRLPARSQLLLIAGGGLGAKSINKLALQVAPKLLEHYPNLYITHVTGLEHQEVVTDSYQLGSEEQERLTVLGYSNEYQHWAAAADLVVSRAGATALAELAILRKAVIVLPAPQLADGHQLSNARELAKAGATHLLKDSVNPEHFYAAIAQLLDDSKKRQELAAALGLRAKPDAASELAELVWGVAQPSSRS